MAAMSLNIKCFERSKNHYKVVTGYIFDVK